MLYAKHWATNDSLKAPEGFELLLHIFAVQLVYHGWSPRGQEWETLIHMFLDKFSIFGADTRAALVNQLRVILLLGVEYLDHYIKVGWDMEYSDENMRVLCSLLEIKIILDKK